MFRKIASSKFLRFGISAILVYFAFRNVNVSVIIKELTQVPLWFILVNLLYSLLISLIGSYRWSLLLFDRPGKSEVFNFLKSTYLGAFYSLAFPTGLAGDLLKWFPLQKKYPELTKTRLLSSVLLDRFIGFSSFTILALISVIIGKILKISFPDFIFWLFLGLSIGVIFFYIAIFSFDVEKIIKKYPLLEKLNEIVSLLKKGNKRRIILSLLVSFLSEFTWIIQTWFVSDFFHAGFSMISVFVFVPIIALVLVLPISFAGFGAREQLYLFFFSQIGIASEKTLLVSTFLGITGILSSLIGGVFLLF